jgi:hypothetical protein
MDRVVYYRISTGTWVYAGRFHDLKTLKGATSRLQRMYPSWTAVEVQYEPFPGQVEGVRIPLTQES